MGEELYNLTPRGFFIPASFDQQKLKAFLKAYREQGNVWDMRVEGIRLVKTLFTPTLHYWLHQQINGDFLSGRRVEFLLDTLQFILSGKRKLGVGNWYELIEELPETKPLKSKPQQEFLFRPYQSILTDPNFIATWCSRPSGFEDMVCTLSIITGEHRETSDAT